MTVWMYDRHGRLESINGEPVVGRWITEGDRDMSKTVERPVRVTITGTAHNVGGGDCIRVTYGPHQSAMLIIGDNVQVEDVTPVRVWTDGDVVQGEYAWERRFGRWSALGSIRWFADDHEVNGWLTNGGVLRVLRYQAGEQ